MKLTCAFGRLGSGSAADGDWTPVSDAGLAAAAHSGLPAAAVVDVNARTTDTAAGPTLTATWSFPVGVIAADDVGELAGLWVSALGALTAHARSGGGGFTPSDLNLVRLGQSAIDDLERRYPAMTDVWPLSPLQAGMLFHAELADESVDAYLVQLILDLGGDVDAERLRRAAGALLDRHPNLRSAFCHDTEGGAVQVVSGRVAVPWRESDLSGLDEDAATAEIERLLAADRTTPFDMATAPLIRFLLVRTAGGRCRLVSTNHHILLDGWSMPLMIRELLTLYATDADPSPPVSYTHLTLPTN